MASRTHNRRSPHRSFLRSISTGAGYDLDLADNRQDSYDWGYNFTLTGQCYGIGAVGGGNYDAEDVIRKSDLVNVIPYWTRVVEGTLHDGHVWDGVDHDGHVSRHVQTPFVNPNDVKLDSESGQFFAYMDDEHAAEQLVAVLDEWLDQLASCYS